MKINEPTAAFAKHRHLRSGLEMTLGGRCGIVHEFERAVLVEITPFVFVAGEPTAGAIARLVDGHIVIDPSDAWRRRLESAFPSSRATMRQSFSADRLDAAYLATIAAEHEVMPIEAASVSHIAAEISTDLFLFPEAFAVDGVGYCAFDDGAPVAAATGAFWTNEEIEIQVNTVPRCRGRGFAAAVSAHLMLACLKRGVTPSWETQDATSARLAERLGYVPDVEYPWLTLASQAAALR